MSRALGVGALAAAAALMLLALPAAATAASPAVPAPAGASRLEGPFLLAGRITVAYNVRGEHVGETVTRLWAFSPLCPSGPCPTISLLRLRAKVADRLVLHRLALGFYSGAGSFYAPLRCGRRVYRRGERVPFTITVRITDALLVNGVAVAGRISASYRNASRINLTPCVAFLGHDAASYHGHLVTAPPPSGGSAP